jgi:putative PEP-CTERM system histidine kinase
VAALGEELVTTREVATFHRVSSFLIHDLKNFAHMLALIVQNAERNMGNPEFQRDAMATVSDIVTKMRRMTTNLSGLTDASALKSDEVDLVALVRETLARLPVDPGVTVEGPFCELPEVTVRGDREELAKVLYNLCNNGREAMDGGGGLSVAVRRDGRFAEVEIADTGDGMSEQFIARELFRPFRTTKKSGLGIGAYQSRSIIEAHGGELRVDSRLGEGTTFTIRLPI